MLNKIISAIFARESLSIYRDDLQTVLNYHKRVNRCATEVDSEVIRGATRCVLVEEYKGSPRRFSYETKNPPSF